MSKPKYYNYKKRNHANYGHYVYDCDGKIKNLGDDQDTIVDHDKYFCVVCSDCCNVPVLHLLTRGEINES